MSVCGEGFVLQQVNGPSDENMEIDTSTMVIRK